MTAAIFEQWPAEGKALLQSAMGKPELHQTFEEARAYIFYAEGRVWKSIGEVWNHTEEREAEWELTLESALGKSGKIGRPPRGEKQNEGQNKHDN